MDPDPEELRPTVIGLTCKPCPAATHVMSSEGVKVRLPVMELPWKSVSGP
jgi:hypothetical protein